MRRLAIILAALVAVFGGLHVPASANHITSFDCEVTDEQRGPYSNLSVGVRWQNNATAQSLREFSIHNWDQYGHTITARYQRDTDGHVYKQQAYTVGTGATIAVGAGWESGYHSQVYHAGIRWYVDSAYVMTTNLWVTAYRGNTSTFATITNCTPAG
jgi:hypothetical protein